MRCLFSHRFTRVPIQRDEDARVYHDDTTCVGRKPLLFLSLSLSLRRDDEEPFQREHDRETHPLGSVTRDQLAVNAKRRGSRVRLSVGRSVGPSVRPSVRLSVTNASLARTNESVPSPSLRFSPSLSLSRLSVFSGSFCLTFSLSRSLLLSIIPFLSRQPRPSISFPRSFSRSLFPFRCSRSSPFSPPFVLSARTHPGLFSRKSQVRRCSNRES